MLALRICCFWILIIMLLQWMLPISECLACSACALRKSECLDLRNLGAYACVIRMLALHICCFWILIVMNAMNVTVLSNFGMLSLFVFVARQGQEQWSISTMMVPMSEWVSRLPSLDVGLRCRHGVETGSRGRSLAVALWRCWDSAAASTALAMDAKNPMTQRWSPKKPLIIMSRPLLQSLGPFE